MLLGTKLLFRDLGRQMPEPILAPVPTGCCRNVKTMKEEEEEDEGGGGVGVRGGGEEEEFDLGFILFCALD